MNWLQKLFSNFLFVCSAMTFICAQVKVINIAKWSTPIQFTHIQNKFFEKLISVKILWCCPFIFNEMIILHTIYWYFFLFTKMMNLYEHINCNLLMGYHQRLEVVNYKISPLVRSPLIWTPSLTVSKEVKTYMHTQSYFNLLRF